MTKSDVHFEVIIGTYEEFLLGYQFLISEDGNKGELSHTFATHSHRASVRSVACGGKLVVSGGSDETINIYNMFARKECGMLMEHNGTITSLSFTPDCSHLISTSEDGTIKVFRQGSWQMEKVWPNAHKGMAVTCLAVHPSGKMALSVGKDHTLRTWNLVKGRPAYTTNLYSRCRQLEAVVWSPGGQLFALPMDCRLELSSTDKAGVLHSLSLPTKVTACVFLSDGVVCVGEASGEISGHCTKTARQLWRLSGEQRVRGLAYHQPYLVSATSSGTISVFSAETVTTQPQLVTSTGTGCRITCLTLYDPRSETRVKKEPPDGDKSLTTSENVGSKIQQKTLKSDLNETYSKPQPKQKYSSEKMRLKIDGTSSLEKINAKNSVCNKKLKKSKEDENVINNQRSSNNSFGFREVDLGQIKVSKRKKRSDFIEEKQKPPKKQKTGSVNTNAICSPQAQKWVVEDSRTS